MPALVTVDAEPDADLACARLREAGVAMGIGKSDLIEAQEADVAARRNQRSGTNPTNQEPDWDES